ncbi:MAG: Bax inhibitor-1/YccA family protein, partial [Planctomycetota bacterium]
IAYSPLAQYVGGEADGLALVGQAAGLTMAIAAAMLMAYSAGLIRLRGIAGKIVIVMTVGVMLYYLGAWLVNMIFGGGTVPQLGWDAGPIGIGFSVFVVVLASLNLVLDFQFVEDGVEKQLPKHYEWLAAFGILTTLVWLYIELLRLLVKLRGLSSD